MHRRDTRTRAHRSHRACTHPHAASRTPTDAAHDGDVQRAQEHAQTPRWSRARALRRGERAVRRAICGHAASMRASKRSLAVDVRRSDVHMMGGYEAHLLACSQPRISVRSVHQSPLRSQHKGRLGGCAVSTARRAGKESRWPPEKVVVAPVTRALQTCQGTRKMSARG